MIHKNFETNIISEYDISTWRGRIVGVVSDRWVQFHQKKTSLQQELFV